MAPKEATRQTVPSKKCSLEIKRPPSVGRSETRRSHRQSVSPSAGREGETFVQGHLVCLIRSQEMATPKDSSEDGEDFVANSEHKHEIQGFRFNICGLLVLLRQLFAPFGCRRKGHRHLPACLPREMGRTRGRLTAAAVKGRLLSDVRVKLNMIFQCCICGPMKKNEFVLEEEEGRRGGDRSRRDSASIVGKCNNSSSAATRRMRSKRRNRSALQWRHYSCIAASLSSPRCGSSD